MWRNKKDEEKSTRAPGASDRVCQLDRFQGVTKVGVTEMGDAYL